MSRPKFRVGDSALHKSATLDPRPVAEVKGGRIKLDIDGFITPWVQARDYTNLERKGSTDG